MADSSKLTEVQIGQALGQWLPSSSILTTAESKRPYETDGLSAYRQMPYVVVLPATEKEVQAVLRYCYDQKIPVVARGAGTGLSGGALPHACGVLLSLAKLKEILEIDVQGCRVRVQPGVRNLAISQAVDSYGLYYAPDPSSQIACTIGGNVAENSGGVHCLKYGLTLHNIWRVRGFTMAGEAVEFGSEAPDSLGFDLMALITGSEGLLAVITEITVRVIPKPISAKVLLASFETVEQAGNAVARIIAAGIIPAGLEMMDALATRAAEDFVHAGYPVEAAAVLLCESDGIPEAVTEELRQMTQILQECGASEIRQARDEAERLKFWAGRKAAFPAVGRISPDYYCIDGTIPRRHLGQVLQRIHLWSKSYGLEVANVFHAGDGNLHPLILYDASIPGAFERTEELAGKILELCVEVGGTITGEHGVGVEKINQMCVQFGAAELEIFHGIKKAFDPAGLLNPGKAIPSLQRCAEGGRMHVHHNQLPHPELPRF
ncbi:MAG: FAD-binding protein [Ferrovum sp.]|nr:FAD-binding protein [Ferrovum sp.]NDU87146.1 FAD-binding protein [Ferrovum sp.]